MVKGRRPIPAGVKAARGNPGKRPLGTAPEIDTLPKCPAWFGPEAKAEWDRVVPQLVATGIISGLDTAILASYCQLYSRWCAAEEMIPAYPVIENSRGAKVIHPACAYASTLLRQLRVVIAELGFSPGSRGRLEIPPSPSQDPLLDFIENNHAEEPADEQNRSGSWHVDPEV